MAIVMDERQKFRLERLSKHLDLEHPWVKQYRVPTTTDLYPGMAYIAALVQPREPLSENPYVQHFLPVTEEDAILVGQYIVYYREWFYNERYKRVLDEMPVDLDGGANTVTFGRMADTWVYRRVSWRDQPRFPEFDSELKFPTLLSLMDSVQSYGGEPNSNWQTFKLEHGIV